MIADEFRDGNIPAGAGAVEFLEYCEDMMPEGKRIKYYRSDSAAYQANVMNHCCDRLVVQRWPKVQAELFDADPYRYHVIATNREEPAEEVVRLHCL